MKTTARELICMVDKASQEQGLYQAEWCRRAGLDEFGKTISRIFNKGDCKLSTLIQLMEPLGLELQLIKKEEDQ